MVQMDTVADDDDRPSNNLEHFTELNEVIAMINNLAQNSLTNAEKSYEIFSEIVGRYQEQPHLLDPHLPQLIDLLLSIIRLHSNNCSDSTSSSSSLFHAAFKYLYQLTKVRTYKVLVKFLPHELNDLSFVINLLESHGEIATDNWETRYILLLWLSILILNPFHMSRLDGFTTSATARNNENDLNHTNELTKMERIYNICKRNVNANDTCARMAAYLSSKYLVRIDIKDVYLPKFLSWILDQYATDISDIKTGQLAAITAILKHGKREDLLPHAEMLLTWTINCNYKSLGDYLKHKYFVKIIQRLGLVFLKPRLAGWRYQRGSRSLTANLDVSAADTIELQNASLNDDHEKDDDIDVPAQIEDIVEELLQALRNASGDIRWSAAKGLGRITIRLPKDLGDEVVGSVIEIINPMEQNEGWHGACLAIAELAKRGLLLPYRLEAMVPLLLQAFTYDEMKGYMSVGQHIRDAACYMSWAFARAYEPTVLEPFVQRIAAGLIVTMVFDREINCRRAASAAFQESVGRLGNFPHGIDIVTEADFYSVGMRSNSYLAISDFVSQYDEYTTPLIDHLIALKINHWDTAIRELTAKTIFKLTKRSSKYMADKVLPLLFTKTDSIDINMRHGSILAIGEIVLSLSDIEKSTNSQGKYLDEKLILLINGLVMKFQERNQFRGLSGDIMNQACCDFIRNCSKANIQANPLCIESWQNVIDACIVKKSPQLRDIAVLALSDLCQTYYIQPSYINSNRILLEKYISGSYNDLEENMRMGYLLAIGSLPAFILQLNLAGVLSALKRHSLKPNVQRLVLDANEIDDHRTENPITANWSESRRDSIKALCNVVQTIGFKLSENGDNDDKCLSINSQVVLDKIFNCLLCGMDEYTIDDRGDIGAWVREASMNALFTMLTTCPQQLLRPEIVHNIMTSISQQAVEIIDRTRGLAGSLFCKLVHHTPAIPYIQQHELLKSIFPIDSTTVLWVFANHTFPLFCTLLEFPEYSSRIVLGLVVSIGKMTESLIKYSSASMYQFLRTHPNHIDRICKEIVDIFQRNSLDKRIGHPMLNFLDSIISSGAINSVLLNEHSNFGEDIYRLVKLEIKGQKNIYKHVSGIHVLCQLIQIPKLCTRILSTLAVSLGLTQVHIRKSTATKLYEAIVLHGDLTSIPEDNIDEILSILSETDWGLPLSEIRPIRNNLCTLLGIKPPTSLTTTPNK